jgi:hypothetical protein
VLPSVAVVEPRLSPLAGAAEILEVLAIPVLAAISIAKMIERTLLSLVRVRFFGLYE